MASEVLDAKIVGESQFHFSGRMVMLEPIVPHW